MKMTTIVIPTERLKRLLSGTLESRLQGAAYAIVETDAEDSHNIRKARCGDEDFRTKGNQDDGDMLALVIANVHAGLPLE